MSASVSGPTEAPQVVPTLAVPASGSGAGGAPSSMRIFTPRQQPSAANPSAHRSVQGVSSRRGRNGAAPSPTPPEGTPQDATLTPSQSHHHDLSTSPTTTTTVQAKRVRPGAKATDAIPSTVPPAAPAHRSPANAPAAAESVPRASVHRTPRVTQKAPPKMPNFSAPPHTRPARNGATLTTTTPVVTSSGAVRLRPTTPGEETTPLSSSCQSRDYVRPPARTTPALRSTLVTTSRPGAASDVSSTVRGESEGSTPPPPQSPPPPAQPQHQKKADAESGVPAARLSSASVVRPSAQPSSASTSAARASNAAALHVYPPQQTNINPAATATVTSHSGTAHPASRGTTARGSAPTTPATPAAPPAKVDVRSSRRSIPSRSTVRPVGSARVGTPDAQNLAMGELVRPADAYKVKLTPTVQQRTLARRSRQPRKILNTFLTKYPVIRRVADVMGFDVEESEDELNAYQFNLCWSDTVLPLVRLVRLGNWQRTNHFPSMYLLCRKIHLATTLGRMQRRMPQDFHFFPMTWSMRSERTQFSRYLAALKQKRLVKYFIVKPNAGCQGRGIQVTRDPLNCVEDPENYIAQEYIPRPLLIEDRKFDLRVYVLLTSIREPSIFMYNDGLVRMCAEVYEAPTDANVKNACKHLTNYAVNKRSPEFVYNTDASRGDIGNKRNFRFFNQWLAAQGEAADVFWEKVGFVIVKTILSAQPHISMVYNSCFPRFNEGHTCFEILGFDILVDKNMKPWLMEVNHTPSFATDTPLDDEIKTGVLTEAWDIIDCKATDYERDRQRERHDFASRNMRSSTGQLASARLRRPAGMPNAYNESPASPETDEQAEVMARLADERLLAARMNEDGKLKNYVRIFPTDIPEYDEVYRNVRQHAEADAAVRATNGSMFVNGITGPVLSANALPVAASPVSATSPCAADTYRFPGNRNGSPRHGSPRYTRTPSDSTTGDAEANGGLASAPARTVIKGSAAAAANGATGIPLRPAAVEAPATAPPQPAVVAPTPPPPPPAAPSQAESYKKLEEEMQRVRRRSSHDISPQARAPATSSTSSKVASTEEATPAATPPPAAPAGAAETNKTRRGNSLTNVASVGGAGAAGASDTCSSPSPAPPAHADPLVSHSPLRTEKKPPSNPSTAKTSAATLSSVVPLSDSVKAKSSAHPSRLGSAREMPVKASKHSGSSTPVHGPNKPSQVAMKEVSPEDLRRLESLQELLERAEEAEPENHESDESFDLDE